MTATLFNTNFSALSRHYPALAARIDQLPNKSAIFTAQAKDGAPVYCLKQNGNVLTITNPTNPVERMQQQVNAVLPQLFNFTRPVMLVGLNPGDELISIFNNSETNPLPHCPQPIWVCIDSTIALYAFLNTRDISHIIASPRVRFFWHEDAENQAQWLRLHPEFPHLFTLISCAPDRTLNLVMPPFARLVDEREQQVEHLKTENNRYYDALSNQELHAIISRNADRPPRLMMPTCSWSTFIQHSTRDTCASFREIGWEVCELNMEAMLTPYYLVSTIHQFKPDVFLFIDHMRYEAEEVYPPNLLFITWIQDEMDNLFCKEAGQSIARYAQERQRDLVIGYTGDNLKRLYDYPPERLVSLNIMANPRVFHPVILTKQQQLQYTCDLAFMTNTSQPTDQIIDQRIIPNLTDTGITPEIARQIHDHLWNRYRAGETFCNRTRFLTELKTIPSFSDAYPALLQSGEEERVIRLFYWKLNDVIYRHVVLEWADQSGLNMHLYGHGWENHPRFSKFACGSLQHGPDLNAAYQAASHCLHLNITQGMHQRVWEITAAGGSPIFRKREPLPTPDLPLDWMKTCMRWFEHGQHGAFPFPENDPIIADWLFRLALNLAKSNPTANEQQLQHELTLKVESILSGRPDVMIPTFHTSTFNTPAELNTLVRS